MSGQGASAKPYEMTAEKYKSPGGILLHSRTVVEKDNFVSTGVLTYAEGDILEVEMTEYKAFELGDSVKLTVYSPGGIYGFTSTVVAKDHGALMIINPPQNQKRFAEKRESPRVEVSQNGAIFAFTPFGGKKQDLIEKVELDLRNISISGIGFTVRSDIKLVNEMLVDAELDLGFLLPVQAEIIRSEATEHGLYFGARYVDLRADRANSLRAFVLKKQVETHFSQKRNELEKRIFK